MPAPRMVGVLGAGTMGAGIAQLACAAGARTLVHDPDAAALERGLAGVRKRLEREVEKGRLEDRLEEHDHGGQRERADGEGQERRSARGHAPGTPWRPRVTAAGPVFDSRRAGYERAMPRRRVPCGAAP